MSNEIETATKALVSAILAEVTKEVARRISAQRSTQQVRYEDLELIKRARSG